MDARQELRNHLKRNSIKLRQFARQIEYDPGNFCRLLKNPDTTPSLNLAVKIERATGGVVPATAWAVAA